MITIRSSRKDIRKGCAHADMRVLLPGVFLCAGLLCSPAAHAEIALPNGIFTEQTEELRVKLIGGAFDLRREFFNGAWQINLRHSSLEFQRDNLDNTIKAVSRNGSAYERQGDAGKGVRLTYL